MFNLRAFGPRLVIPASFSDCLSYGQQVLWLLEHKSPILTAGDNITLTENENGTITVSSEQEDAHTYSIKKITHVEPVVPSGQVVWYEYQLVDENNEQHGDSVRVNDTTYTITKTPYDGGYDYNLVKDGYITRGETIRVPNAGQGGGLYRAGGSLVGATNPEQGHQGLDQIGMTLRIFTGNPFQPTIVTVPSNQCSGVCSIAWDERTEEPYRSVMFNPTTDFQYDVDYPVEADAYLSEAVSNAYQVAVRFEFDGILDIPLNTEKAIMLMAVNLGSDEQLVYNPISFSQDSANSKTYVSTYVVLPSGSTVNSVNVKGLTIFS
jgi:hypothetical protein